MENLNAENIKRGLACCKGSYDCFTCDIYKRGCAGWREGLAKDALALINSQDQRIKELTEERDGLENLVHTAIETQNRMSDTIEGLQLLMTKVSEDNEKLGEENEGLTSSIKILVNNNADLEFELAQTYDLLEESKADTVRKMHSEIKERCIKGGIYPAFVASTIDQIAKEMLEDK